MGSLRWDNIQHGCTVKMETRNENMCRVLASKDRHPVAPFSGLTRLVDPNGFRDARLILFIYFSFGCLFFFFFFVKVS